MLVGRDGLAGVECVEGCLERLLLAGTVTAGNWSLTIEGAPGKRRHASMGDAAGGKTPAPHADGFPRWRLGSASV